MGNDGLKQMDFVVDFLFLALD